MLSMTRLDWSTMTSAPRFSGVLYGAAYYAEYQPVERTEHDLDLMQEAGFTVIRVGESVWSTWEPREGEFDLEWLLPVLDGAHQRGIGVILGMPTYAVPMWLARRYPEIAAETATGQRVGWGARQEMDQSHPAYRFFAERIVRKVTERYAGHPAVIGFQVDNEPGMLLPHNEGVFQRFVDWLRARYGTVEALNEAWGLVYWSHRLSDWADLWRPDGNFQPQYDLEWRRFQSTLATELMRWQADVVREYARDDQFITTCISYQRPQVSDDELVEPLDVVAGNPYYKMQDGLDQPGDLNAPERWWHASVWALHEWGDRAWSSADCQYLVTETDAQSIGGPWTNFPPYPGQLKQAAFALLSRGGRLVEYWHWHTLHFGVETYWGGVLPHSGKPGRIYREVAQIGAAFRAIGSALDDYVPDADVLMLYSTDTKWSYDFYPPLADAQGGPDRGAYARIFDAIYRGLFAAGAQVRIQHVRRFLATPVEELVRQHPVLIAPALYVAGDDVLEHLRAYAAAGGHLVLGIRTGYGDELARARWEVAPAKLSDAARLRYDVYSNLDAELPVSSDGAVELEPGAAGEHWVDVVELDGAEVLARFASNELGAEAALTSTPFGAGRISYLPTIPNPALARSLARWLVPERANDAWSAGESVTVVTGVSARRRIAFVSNWSASPGEVVVPTAVRDLVSGEQHNTGASLLLEPRSAVVFEVADSSPE
jgi:beta-galactosidase